MTKTLLLSLLLLGGCYLSTAPEPPDLCYTLDSLAVGETCTNEQVSYWESETFERDLPENASEYIWLSEEDSDSTTVEILYQLHIDANVLVGGFATVYYLEDGGCRASFVVHSCSL